MKTKNAKSESVSLVVVGSVALDTVITPFEKRSNVLGGSVSYACHAASFFGPVGMVGVIGQDFPRAFIETYRRSGIDITGLKSEKGKTFRWSGEYEMNMNNRRTISTDLNVFAGFMPELPDAYRKSPFLFLANISPGLQLHVLSQVKSPRFVAADTMDLWIKTDKKNLERVIARVDMLLVNDSEVRMLSGEHSIAKAVKKILKMGPKFVVVKKGEHGAVIFSGSGMFIVPAYPVEDVCDPTGAGDTFAGGFMGSLALAGKVTPSAICQAMIDGSVMASFGVEAFSVNRLTCLKQSEIKQRTMHFRKIMSGL